MELQQQTLTATALDTQAPTPVTLITLVGDIDGSTAPGVQADVLAAAAPDIKIILEMTQVPYMSSAGLRVLHHERDRLFRLFHHCRQPRRGLCRAETTALISAIGSVTFGSIKITPRRRHGAD
jgi:anti-anti-sigma factor